MLALYITLSLLVLFLILYFTVGYVVFKSLFLPKKRTNEMLLKYEVEQKKFDAKLLDIPAEIITIQSQFGYKLNARCFTHQEKTSKWVVVVHGHNSSSLSQLKYLSLFVEMGYNVIIPDHRASGDSEGKYISFGYFEKYDIISWIDLITKRDKNATFGIFGESMGASTAIMVAGMDERIKFLISYCGYSSFMELARAHIGVKVPKFVKYCLPAFKIVARVLANIKIDEIDAEKAMKKITVPTLIIHSKADQLVSIDNAYTLIKANPNAQVKIFENSQHARSYPTYPQEYKNTVQSFLAELTK